MKSKITLGAVKINVPGEVAGIEKDINIEFGGAEIHVEYSLSEMTGLYQLQKQAMEEVPGLVHKFMDEIMQNSFSLHKKYENIEDGDSEEVAVG